MGYPVANAHYGTHLRALATLDQVFQGLMMIPGADIQIDVIETVIRCVMRCIMRTITNILNLAFHYQAQVLALNSIDGVFYAGRTGIEHQ
jgi:hypothetical protein